MRIERIFMALCIPLLAADKNDQLVQRTTVLPLSLKKAVEIALSPEGSTRLQLATEALKQSEARSAEARAALLPDVEAQISDSNQTRNLAALGLQFPVIPGFRIPTVVGPFNVFDARTSVNQSVFDFSSIRRFQASKVSVGASKSDLDNTRDQVMDQVARAYLAGLRAQTAVETAKANVDLSEALLKLSRSQKEAGTGTGIEITRAQVQLANDRQRLLEAENQRTRANLQLLKVIGVRLDNPVQLTDRLSYLPVDPEEEEKAVKLARDTRPDLKAQQERETSARLSYSSVKMERIPSIAAFGDYGPTGTNTSQIPTREYGIALRIPIFDGGRRDARRAESASQLRQEKIRTADLKDQIELEVRTALDSLRSADAQVKASREGLQLAENELAQARRRYQAGVTNSVEVTDAQTRLDRARQNEIDALYNHNLARIDLATAMGRIETAVQ
ncbi:MAG TPA: TolC family protein [Bryobacteraceae bacterium]|nr:TolC family protein [Bryobacteraceae bacterium]